MSSRGDAMPDRRQLAAIMFTDIEGYAARVGTDEKRAIAGLAAIYEPIGRLS